MDGFFSAHPYFAANLLPDEIKAISSMSGGS
jgi:hypothetical protein